MVWDGVDPEEVVHQHSQVVQFSKVQLLLLVVRG